MASLGEKRGRFIIIAIILCNHAQLQSAVGVERNRNQVFVPERDIWFLSLTF